MHSENACEYAIHGRDNKQQCCPHGITRFTSPDTCCIDDLQRTPYRLRYLYHEPTVNSTTWAFDVALVPAYNDVDFDGTELGRCDRMSLEYTQIQICECHACMLTDGCSKACAFGFVPAMT